MVPEKVCIIIGACAVLHNIAAALNEPMEDGELGDQINGEVYGGPDQGQAVRNYICSIFFGWMPSFGYTENINVVEF